MRVPAAIFAISFAVACTSLAATRQGEPLAETQFKNIVSFKGQKASDVVPAMEFMSASLGVQCSFCHVADRASDEKQEKKTAREMIAMQKDIDDKNFGGRPQVTCATCHAGHTHPVGVPPVSGLEVRARRSPDVAPDQVLSAYAKALYGDFSAGPGTLHVIGKSAANGQSTPFEATYAEGKFYVSAGGQKHGFNGTMAWFGTPNGVQKVPLEYALQYVREDTIFLTPDSLPKQDTPSGGTAKIDGKDMVTLTGNVAGTKARSVYFFDKKTGLLARTAFFYPSILGSIEQINDYSNYQKVGGVQVPMKIVNHTPEGDTVKEFKSADSPRTIDVSQFDPPK